MGLFGGDFGLSEFLYQKLSRFKKKLPHGARRRIANFVTNTVFIFSIAGPIMTIPQVIKIYAEQNVSGLSVYTWASYLFFAFFWLTYGVFIRNRPIILANTCWIVIHIFIMTGIFLYR